MMVWLFFGLSGGLEGGYKGIFVLFCLQTKFFTPVYSTGTWAVVSEGMR
jgi:hypothetical protein